MRDAEARYVDVEENLPKPVWDALITVANGMLRDQVMSRAFKMNDVSGRLETEFTLNEEEGVKSIQFLASIETAEGEYEIGFELVVERAGNDPPDLDHPLFTVWHHPRGGRPN